MSKQNHKKKQYSANDKTFSLILKSLDSFQTNVQAMTWMRNHLSDDQIVKYLPKICNHFKYKSTISKNLFPKTIKELGKHVRLDPSGYIISEIAWYDTLFNIYSNEINSFLELRERYNYLLLKGDSEQCLIILDEIEEKIGYSLWTIENRINLYSIFNMKEDMSNYMKNIYSEDIDQLTLYITHTFYHRSDLNNSYNNFKNTLLKSFEQFERQNYEYFIYKLCYLSNMEIKSITMLLYYEGGFSLIDIYLTVVNILKFLYTVDDADLHSKVSSILDRFIGFHDSSIITMLKAYNKEASFTPTKSYNLIIENLFKGKFEQVIETCENSIIEELYDMETIFLLIESMIFENKVECPGCIANGSLLKTIFVSLVNIANKSNISIDTYNSLLKIITLYTNEPWAIQIYYFLNNEFNVNEASYNNEISILSFNWDSRFLINIIPSEFLQAHINEIDHGYNFSFTAALLAAENNEIAMIEEIVTNNHIKKELISKIYLKESNYDAAINLFLQDIQNPSNEYEYFYAVKNCSELYARIGKLGASLEVVVDGCMRNSHVINSIDIDLIMDQLKDDSLDASFKILIDYPIFCYLISNFAIESYSVRISIAYEEFLEFNHAMTPVKLLDNYKQFNQAKLVFFLKNICVQSIMDDSIYFSSSDEIERERINICQWLISELIEEEKFSEEIKNITQRLLINNLMRKIESSKISVDVEGIKNNNETLFKEYYQIFRANLDLEEGFETLKCMLSNYFSEDTTLVFLQPKARQAFRSFLMNLKQEFLFNDTLGLDTCLSIRIRHGTLTGQLRSNLVNNNLITQKGEDNEYKRNEYWINKIKDECPHVNEDKLAENLLIFTKSIDGLIDELKNKWIQINDTISQSEALFNYYLSEEEVALAYDKAKKIVSYEEFIDFGVNYLWQQTEKNLQNVRQKIKNELNDKFNEIFFILDTELNMLQNSTSVSELKSKVASSRTDMQYELDKISDWFKLEKINEMQDFHIITVHDIAFQMLKNVYADKVIGDRFTDDTQFEFKGKLQKSFVDMLYIIFDNVVKHSQLDGEMYIETIVSRDKEYCIMTIKNRLGSGLDIDSLIRRLDKIKDKIKNNSSLANVRREGGTGLYKINKILTADIGGKSKFNCYVENHEYIIRIYIELEGNVNEDLDN